MSLLKSYNIKKPLVVNAVANPPLVLRYLVKSSVFFRVVYRSRKKGSLLD